MYMYIFVLYVCTHTVCRCIYEYYTHCIHVRVHVCCKYSVYVGVYDTLVLYKYMHTCILHVYYNSKKNC